MIMIFISMASSSQYYTEIKYIHKFSKYNNRRRLISSIQNSIVVFTDSYYMLVCVTALILALVFTGSYQSNSNVALLSGPVLYSVLLILLVTLWQNI